MGLLGHACITAETGFQGVVWQIESTTWPVLKRAHTR